MNIREMLGKFDNEAIDNGTKFYDLRSMLEAVKLSPSDKTTLGDLINKGDPQAISTYLDGIYSKQAQQKNMQPMKPIREAEDEINSEEIEESSEGNFKVNDFTGNEVESFFDVEEAKTFAAEGDLASVTYENPDTGESETIWVSSHLEDMSDDLSEEVELEEGRYDLKPVLCRALVSGKPYWAAYDTKLKIFAKYGTRFRYDTKQACIDAIRDSDKDLGYLPNGEPSFNESYKFYLNEDESEDSRHLDDRRYYRVSRKKNDEVYDDQQLQVSTDFLDTTIRDPKAKKPVNLQALFLMKLIAAEDYATAMWINGYAEPEFVYTDKYGDRWIDVAYLLDITGSYDPNRKAYFNKPILELKNDGLLKKITVGGIAYVQPTDLAHDWAHGRIDEQNPPAGWIYPNPKGVPTKKYLKDGSWETDLYTTHPDWMKLTSDEIAGKSGSSVNGAVRGGTKVGANKSSNASKRQHALDQHLANGAIISGDAADLYDTTPSTDDEDDSDLAGPYTPSASEEEEARRIALQNWKDEQKRIAELRKAEGDTEEDDDDLFESAEDIERKRIGETKKFIKKDIADYLGLDEDFDPDNLNWDERTLDSVCGPLGYNTQYVHKYLYGKFKEY